jgi:hypothetical protein
VVVGLGSATETIGGAAGSGIRELQEVSGGVDDLAAEPLEHPLLQRHRRCGARRGDGPDRRRRGLGEYYSEADTRTPTWLLVGDAATMAELTGLDVAAVAGGVVDTGVAAAWLDDGVAPNGVCGRAFSKGSVHGFDLTFAAPGTGVGRAVPWGGGAHGIRRCSTMRSPPRTRPPRLAECLLR